MTVDLQALYALADSAHVVFSHRKFSTMSSSALGVWMRMLVYLRIERREAVPDALIRKWKGARALAELEQLALIRKVQGGYRMRSLDSPVESPATPVASVDDAVMTFPVVGDEKEWTLTRDLVKIMEEAYPIDVHEQLRLAKGWLELNPSRRKTARGMPRFLSAWMMNTIDRRKATRVGTGRTGATQGKYAKVHDE
jgi:hypothetical protein